MRGTEDLGADLKAHFQLEGGINPDTGTQSESLSLFDRRALIWLSGSWGKLDIGRTPTFGWDYTPVYDLSAERWRRRHQPRAPPAARRCS